MCIELIKMQWPVGISIINALMPMAGSVGMVK